MGRAVHLEKKGLERQGDFFVLYECGYPDFNNLMSFHIDEISIFFSPPADVSNHHSRQVVVAYLPYNPSLLLQIYNSASRKDKDNLLFFSPAMFQVNQKSSPWDN